MNEWIETMVWVLMNLSLWGMVATILLALVVRGIWSVSGSCLACRAAPALLLATALASMEFLLPLRAAEENNDASGDWRETVPVAFSIRVETKDAEPVANAELWVWESANSTGDLDDRVRGHGHTDARGVLSFEAPLAKSQHLLYALARTADQAGLLYFSAPKPTPDLTVEATVVLRPTAPARVRVLNPDGSPAGGVKLRGASYSDMSGGGFFGHPPGLPGGMWQAVTDADGRCEISSVPKGVYLFLDHDRQQFASFPGFYSMATMGVLAGGEEKMLRFQPGGSIVGRILLPDGSPVDNAHLMLVEHDPYVTAFGGTFATGADGRFEIDRVPPSRYRIASMIGWGTEGKWIGPGESEVLVEASATTDLGDLSAVEANRVTARILDADSGEEIEEPLEFYGAEGLNEFYYRGSRMPPEGYGEPTIGTVNVMLKKGEEAQIEFRLPAVKMYRGRVVDENGKAQPGAVVSATFPYVGRGNTVTADAEGRFKITPPEDVQSVVLLASADRGRAVSQPVEIDGAAFSGHELVVKRGSFASISGTVVDEEGQPLHGVRVSWDLPDFSLQKRTAPFAWRHTSDADGRFEVPRFWAEVDVILEARKEGYVLPQKERPKVTTAAEQASVVTLVMRKADRSVGGVVRHADGRPAVAATVYSRGGNQLDYVTPTKTDAEGKFVLPGLVAGAAYVTASVNTEAYGGSVEKLITVGEDDDLEMTLPRRDGKIAGRIVTTGDKPLPHAKLFVWEAQSSRESSTDEGGRFEIAGLAEGWISLVVYPFGSETEFGRTNVRIKVGQLDAELVLADPGTKAATARSLPMEKRDMIGVEAPPIAAAKWFNIGDSAPAAEKPASTVRIVDFWGTACAPCLAGFPKIDEFWKRHGGDERLEFMAVTSDTDPLEVEELIQGESYTFPVGIFPPGDESWIDYEVRGIPTYVVIDRDNQIVSYGHDWNAAAAKALELLGE